jgi:four helix bundle protein
MAIDSYRDLKVWPRGMDIVVDVYELTKQFPSDERFGLTSQMRRCAASIPANIAEGSVRNTTKDYL